ncbi:hypothetical protein ACFLRC_04960, partial [Candidatus Altiarchaeota archaeon]
MGKRIIIDKRPGFAASANKDELRLSPEIADQVFRQPKDLSEPEKVGWRVGDKIKTVLMLEDWPQVA